MIPETKVIKAFNHVFAQIIADEMTQRTIAFIVSGDKVAKTTVKPIIESIGFDVINVGCAKKPCISIISCASSSTWARTLHSS